MKIAQKYSHLNGEEYLLVHKPKLLKELTKVIESVDADKLRTKVSEEKTMKGKKLLSPKALNKEFNSQLTKLGWVDTTYRYYVTTDRELMQVLTNP